MLFYLGANCESDAPEVVDLDAGKSSLRYSAPYWQLNWQTGQSTLNDGPLVSGCYRLDIPLVSGSVDTKHFKLSN